MKFRGSTGLVAPIPLAMGPDYGRTFVRNHGTIRPNSIFVISLPITTQKSFIYCNHKPKSILDPSQLKNTPIITKIENKATQFAVKGWTKLSTSKLSVNIKVTQFVKRLLDTIPYEESSLRSFPSKNSMIREINKETMDSEKSKPLIQTEIDSLQIPTNQIKPIPLYHPTFQNVDNILTQLYRFRDENYATYRKYTILCAIGIPVSLPFAIVPVIPNIPGFYIAYRFYCNLKALLGIKHLDYLLARPEDLTSSDTQHLTFVSQSIIDDIYQKYNSKHELIVDSVQEEERLIITQEIIDQVTKQLELPQIHEDLSKALRQETKRLGKDIKVEDAVQ